MQVASHVNEAYQTLRDPLTRGRYLLRLRGVDTGEETDSVMSPAFLMAQMELREELDEAKRASDRASRIARIGETLRQSMDERLAKLREALALTDSAGGQRARALVRELQFLRKVQAEIELYE
jgi:molecular chaperone HscB